MSKEEDKAFEKWWDEFATQNDPYENYPKLNNRVMWFMAKTVVKMIFIGLQFIVVAFVHEMWLRYKKATPELINKTTRSYEKYFGDKIDKLDRDLVIEEIRLEDVFL